MALGSKTCKTYSCEVLALCLESMILQMKRLQKRMDNLFLSAKNMSMKKSKTNNIQVQLLQKEIQRNARNKTKRHT